MWKCNSCGITGKVLPLKCPTGVGCNVQFGDDVRDPILVEREKTHGSFSINATYWNRFLHAIEGAPVMDAEQTLAMHMIFVKLSRILGGQAGHKDHWDDIAGYAKLGAEACE